MSSPNPQHEPTMEEILASIRKIISEDQPAGGNGAAAAAPAPSAEAAPAADAEGDVLELTEEVADDSAPQAAPVAARPLDNDIAFESIEEPKHEPRAMQPDDLISDNARSALGRAISHLNQVEDQPPPSGTLDALFMRAVQDAFVPALHEWIDGRHDDIMAQLKPLIRSWMDEHLPPLIEAAVVKEIARAVPGRRR